MKSKKFFSKFVLFSLLLFLSFHQTNLCAQTLKAKNVNYIPEIEVLFGEGVSAYQNKNYQQAKDIFTELLKDYPTHQRITATYIMLAKCFYKLGNDKKAISLVDELIRKFPNSNYEDDAHFIKGFSLYRQGKYLNSLNEFLYVADNGKNGKLIEKSRNLALKIIDNNLTLEEIKRLRDKATGEISIAILTIKLAHRYINIGKRQEAVALLQNFINHYPKNPYISYVKRLLNNTHIPLQYEEIKIGVILPLSGEYAEQARSVLAGIRYAQKKFNSNSNLKIKLIIKDSEGDIIKVVRAAQELSRDSGIMAIIGELERDKTVAIAAVINDLNIPLISPVTSGNGVASLNEYTFQINTDLETRGYNLAHYAVKQLGLKTFATLAPADDYGKQMTDSFISTVDQLGGTIIAQKWYYSGTEDLGRQFKSIREQGFNLMNKDSLIEAYTKDMTDFQKKRFDEEVIPVTSIHGVFFPCYTEDIQFIAPQFAFVNVKAQMLGGEYWYDEEELRKVQKYVEGLVFCSSYYIDESDLSFIKFRNDFRVTMKRTPGVMEFYGVDALNVLLDAVSHRRLTREDIRNYLDNLENFKGVAGYITFKGNNRVNSQIRFLTYKNGRIQPLE